MPDYLAALDAALDDAQAAQHLLDSALSRVRALTSALQSESATPEAPEAVVEAPLPDFEAMTFGTAEGEWPVDDEARRQVFGG